jgi:hypothetical protein
MLIYLVVEFVRSLLALYTTLHKQLGRESSRIKVKVKDILDNYLLFSRGKFVVVKRSFSVKCNFSSV